MQIEELPPNKPNFGLIVGLFAVTIVVILLVGIFFIRWDGKRLTFRHSLGAHASLITPPVPGSEAALLPASSIRLS